jgi:hypothetical protein
MVDILKTGLEDGARLLVGDQAQVLPLRIVTAEEKSIYVEMIVVKVPTLTVTAGLPEFSWSSIPPKRENCTK